MTGRQALGRVAATSPMQPGHVACRACAYQRHGTPTWIGNAPVATGHLVAATLAPARTEGGGVRPVAQAVATDAEAPWVFGVGDVHVHGSEGLVPWVARTCGIAPALGEKRPTRCAAFAGKSPRVCAGTPPAEPRGVPAEAYVLAQPAGDRLR